MPPSLTVLLVLLWMLVLRALVLFIRYRKPEQGRGVVPAIAGALPPSSKSPRTVLAETLFAGVIATVVAAVLEASDVYSLALRNSTAVVVVGVVLLQVGVVASLVVLRRARSSRRA